MPNRVTTNFECFYDQNPVEVTPKDEEKRYDCPEPAFVHGLDEENPPQTVLPTSL